MTNYSVKQIIAESKNSRLRPFFLNSYLQKDPKARQFALALQAVVPQREQNQSSTAVPKNNNTSDPRYHMPGLGQTASFGPTTRSYNPVMAVYNLAAILSGQANRHKFKYYRPFKGQGPDIIGSVTDFVGLAVNEGVYIRDLRLKLREAERTGDKSASERLKRSLVYARLGTFGTLASITPTLLPKPGPAFDSVYKLSRIARGVFINPLKAAVMMDGIQEDLKAGNLSRKDAAAYTFSALARLATSCARNLIPKTPNGRVIINAAYSLDCAMAGIENLMMGYSYLKERRVKPFDSWACLYEKTTRTFAKPALGIPWGFMPADEIDNKVLAIGHKVNWAIERMGLHNESGTLRKTFGGAGNVALWSPLG